MKGHYMQKLRCSRCDKRLWKKHARMIDGKIMCSACVFAPAIGDTRRMAETRSGSGRSPSGAGAEGNRPTSSGIAHPISEQPNDLL